MDWYDISDDSWLATAFGDVNSDGYFDVLPEEPPLTDLYVGPPDDDLVDDTTVDDVASPTAGAQVEPFAEHIDANCWMLSDDPDARESDQDGVSASTAGASNGCFFTDMGQIIAPPW